MDYQNLTVSISKTKQTHKNYNRFSQMLFKVSFDKQIHILKSGNAKTLQQLKVLVPKVFKSIPKNFYLTYLDQDNDEITLATEADYNILIGTGAKSSKILVRERTEDFYDETQQVQLEENNYKEIEALMEKESAINQASEIRSNSPHEMSVDESIEEKLKSMLPEIISKIKTEVKEEMSQSRISESSTRMSEPKVEAPKVVHKHYICDGCNTHGIVGVRYRCSVCNNYDLCQKCQATSDHPHPFLKIKHPKQSPLKIFVVLNDEEDSVEINGNKQPIEGLSNLIEQGINFAQSFVGQNGMPGFNFKRPQQQPQKQECPKKEEEKVETKVELKPEPKVEQKVESKPEPKVETKAVWKIEANIMQKTSRKVEEKPVEKVEPVEQKEAEKDKKKEQQQRVIENANYLTNILEINFAKGFKFSQKYPEVTKEELLELYFSSELQ